MYKNMDSIEKTIFIMILQWSCSPHSGCGQCGCLECTISSSGCTGTKTPACLWDRFIRSCDLVGYSCMLWKGHCSTKSDLADFIQYRAVWVEAAPGSRRTCLTFVEPRYQSAIHLTILPSFLIPTLKSCLIYLGDLRLDYLPKTQHCWA